MLNKFPDCKQVGSCQETSRHPLYLQGWRCRAAQLWSCRRCCTGGATRAAGSAWGPSPSHHPHLIPRPGPTQENPNAIIFQPLLAWRTPEIHLYACMLVYFCMCTYKGPILSYVDLPNLNIILASTAQERSKWGPSCSLVCRVVNMFVSEREQTCSALQSFSTLLEKCSMQSSASCRWTVF